MNTCPTSLWKLVLVTAYRKFRRNTFSLFPKKSASFYVNVHFFTLSYKNPFCVTCSYLLPTVIDSKLRSLVLKTLCNDNLCLFISDGNIKDLNLSANIITNENKR